MVPSRQPERESGEAPRPQTRDVGAPEGSAKALGIAYAYLNKRDRTVAEVRARLERAELPAGDIEEAIAELVEFGYLDDARYAQVFVEDKRNLEQWGRERIERALRERGVERDVMVGVLERVDDADELERAVELLGRRFPGGPAEPRDRERAFGVLIRKGYGSEVAADAVRAWRAA